MALHFFRLSPKMDKKSLHHSLDHFPGRQSYRGAPYSQKNHKSQQMRRIKIKVRKRNPATPVKVSIPFRSWGPPSLASRPTQYLEPTNLRPKNQLKRIKLSKMYLPPKHSLFLMKNQARGKKKSLDYSLT